MSVLTPHRPPFVRVTVVRAQRPTSVHPGDSAVVLADGTIEGFVGGVCAQEAVRSTARDALHTGEAVLLRVLPDEAEPFPATPGAVVVRNPCLSGGAMEMFLEPMLPSPTLAVVGDSPVARALRTLAPHTGFELVAPTPSGDHAIPRDHAIPLAVVVATLGQDDHGALREALAAGAPFVGLVASPKRGAGVLSELGLSDADRARVHTPVGLWIGARTPQEIAVSIVAELIQAMRLEGLETGSAPDAPAVEPVVDPVCGMTVTPGPGVAHLVVDGEMRWFCSSDCRERYAAGLP